MTPRLSRRLSARQFTSTRAVSAVALALACSTPDEPSRAAVQLGASDPGAGDAGSPGMDAGFMDAGRARMDAGTAADGAAPISDEDLRFILEDGFQTTYFAIHCSAVADDGTVVDGDTVTELPVGDGYSLECVLDRLPSRAAIDVLSAANEPWCALGELQSFEPGGDERLGIVLVSPPDSPSPTLVATHDDGRITVPLAAVFGAPVWPVWLVTSYDVTELAPAQSGKLCAEVFEL